VPNIVGRHDDLVARLTDRGRASRQNDIGIEGMLMSGRDAVLPGVGPKDSGLSHLIGCDRSIQQTPGRDEFVETLERSRCKNPSQFTANLVIGNLWDYDLDSPSEKGIHPEMKRSRFRVVSVPARQPK
jgi:hypothetical protein